MGNEYTYVAQNMYALKSNVDSEATTSRQPEDSQQQPADSQKTASNSQQTASNNQQTASRQYLS